MTMPFVYPHGEPPIVPTPSELPEDFIELSEPMLPGVDRKLGYFGHAQFVLFYYEPRGEEVIWKDSWSYGFGTGAWAYFVEHIVPLAKRYGVELSSSKGRGSETLVMDRRNRSAYLAKRKSAERFLARQRVLVHQAEPLEIPTD